MSDRDRQIIVGYVNNFIAHRTECKDLVEFNTPSGVRVILSAFVDETRMVITARGHWPHNTMLGDHIAELAAIQRAVSAISIPVHDGQPIAFVTVVPRSVWRDDFLESDMLWIQTAIEMCARVEQRWNRCGWVSYRIIPTSL